MWGLWVVWMALAPVTLQVYPHMSLAPAEVRLTVRVEPHESNRRLAVAWGRDIEEGRSERQLDEFSPRTFYFWPKLLGQGEWFAQASVLRANNGVVSSRVHFQVCPCEP